MLQVKFPDEGHRIIFNIFDRFRNGTMYYDEYLRWHKYSFVYTQFTKEGICNFYIQKDTIGNLYIIKIMIF